MQTSSKWQAQAVLVGLHWQDTSLQSHWLLPTSGKNVLAKELDSQANALRSRMAFVRACLQWGPQEACRRMTGAHQELVVTVEAEERITATLWLDGAGLRADQAAFLLCYTFTIAADEKGQPAFREERLLRYSKEWQQKGEPFLFPEHLQPQIVLEKRVDIYYDCFLKEGNCQGECGRFDSFWFGRQQAALFHVPAERSRYPTAHAVKEFVLSWIG
ncbi:hypothetical protein [Candidatus Magnetaquicoccus inordinatus]|uniref:hypothetical protein n=1 Tax=Candidatus Magnetaquicoccus inordinatus TaxID=2496818 RepID=UPI00102AE34D|nr:hypothetical protein [Candidatus Magnetaquicoccus inordinatus]